MQNTKERAKATVGRLVERFRQLNSAQVRAYNEENTKKDFILPLFQALGWHVESAQEVAAEERASGGRVDYAFKLQGMPCFYLEAKSLDADLMEERWARQVITYAYHKGVTWAVLCNFAGLRVFNANLSATGPVSGLVLNLSASDYVGDFDRLWCLSREGTESGLLESEARKTGHLPTRIPVEQRLYTQLRSWRERLFNATWQYRPELSHAQVDEIIQRLFNRLIFIRTCEDRQLEEHELRAALHRYRDGSLGGRQPLLEELRRIFRRYDGYYDSDLFNLHQVDQTHFDEDTIADILAGLHSVSGAMADYDFSLIDADILGAVYEQYLGHVAQEARRREQEAQRQMRLGLPGEVTYEIAEKLQRRKEQGIYYTPKWVVDYIVRQTVGRFIEEHRRRPDAIHEVKILDMACGSGSFLIRAYDELLNWQAEHTGMAVEHLTQEYRMPVLRNNIYGVDLDPQAVEIARLNLLLRALAERARLPTLEENIGRGNSLISGTEEELRPYFGDGWEDKRPFNWEREFPEVMGRGGFDIVIGNPPYLFGEFLNESDKQYFKDKYEVARGQFDSYWLFMERALRLVKEGGYHAYIVPDALLVRDEVAVVRKHFLDRAELLSIAHVGLAFAESAVSATIIVVRKAHPYTEGHFVEIQKVDDAGRVQTLGTVPQTAFVGHDKHAFVLDLASGWQELRQKITNDSVALQALVSISRGEEFGKKNLDRRLSRTMRNEEPILVGEDVKRYCVGPPRHIINRDLVTKSRDNYRSPKILVVKTGERLVCAPDFDHLCTLQSLYNLHVRSDCPYHFNCILGLVNSSLMSFYIRKEVTSYKRLFPQINQGHISSLPIRCIDLSNATDKQMHDALVALVERMLALQERVKPVRGSGLSEEHDILREVERVDKDIDNLVYDLYGLTTAERSLVEGG